MFKLAIKSLLARKLRLLLMVFAIVIGVSFVVSSFVISDSLRSTFNNLSANIESKTDLTVRSKQAFGSNDLRPLIDESVLGIVKTVPGVQAAQGAIGVQSGITPIKANGDPIKSLGPPIIGVNTSDSPELNQLIPVEGRTPVGESEFSMDVDSAKENDFIIGNTYTVSLPVGNRQLTLVGTFAFNTKNNDTVGATIIAFDTPSAQKLLNMEGRFNEIAIALSDDGQTAQVQKAITAKLPPGTEVVDRSVKVAENQDSFDQIASIIGTALLAFAIVTVVVSAFLINNTFRIIIGQRIRELALLRALGATGRQVTASVIGEALLVGLVASAVGIVAGLGLAQGLRGIFSAIGFALPDGPTLIKPTTIIAALFVGVGVTLVSALLPALKVRHIPPIAALRDDFQLQGTGLRRRIVVGSVVTVVGAALLALGLFGGLATTPLLSTLALGALTLFVGVNLLSPVFAVPVARGLGWPIARFRGVAGRIARDNSARNPRRTSSTAAALMIGVALVSMVAVVGASIKETFRGLLDNAVEADYFVRPDAFAPGAGFTPDLAIALRAHREIESVEVYQAAQEGAQVNGTSKNLQATDFSILTKHLDPNVRSGDITSAGPNDVLVHKDSAKDNNLKVGDSVEMSFIDGKTETLRVAAIYDDATILGNWVVSLDVWHRHFASNLDQFITVRATDRNNPNAADAVVKEEVDKYPSVTAENKAEFKKTQEARITTFLNIIQGMLVLALLIALLGIYNTLRLSIYERTRELGLLRAVGMSRAQMRVMIRWEAAIVAVFGAVLGVVLGVLFGVAAATALPNSFIKSIQIPVLPLIIYVIVAAIFGLIAAIFPARRAARLNVLDAISHT
jgi:putative ABC transport system permease protein